MGSDRCKVTSTEVFCKEPWQQLFLAEEACKLGLYRCRKNLPQHT